MPSANILSLMLGETSPLRNTQGGKNRSQSIGKEEVIVRIRLDATLRERSETLVPGKKFKDVTLSYTSKLGGKFPSPKEPVRWEHGDTKKK